jgi:hypothetical protein
MVGQHQLRGDYRAELKDEIGFGNFMLVTGLLGNLGQDQVVETLELFAREVMPRFERQRASSTCDIELG